MRNVFKENEYNLVTNLFTSFGYFDDHKDEQKAINSMAKNLKKEGMLLIDFMNVKKVINSLIPSEKKIIAVGFVKSTLLKDLLMKIT
ncbi:hypothetical protein OA521_02005 [bacterium]|nr:hypothetical protein [bacterium]